MLFIIVFHPPYNQKPVEMQCKWLRWFLSAIFPSLRAHSPDVSHEFNCICFGHKDPSYGVYWSSEFSAVNTDFLLSLCSAPLCLWLVLFFLADTSLSSLLAVSKILLQDEIYWSCGRTIAPSIYSRGVHLSLTRKDFGEVDTAYMSKVTRWIQLESVMLFSTAASLYWFQTTMIFH